MEKIKRFIECMMPYYNCNLKCDYCYVIQGNYRGKKGLQFDYSLDVMKRALTKERFGGLCFFSICAGGETLAPSQTIPIVKMLLENGHFVNITTNGTLEKRIDELCALSPEHRAMLHLSLSLHYLELKKADLVDVFFENIDKLKNAGISFFVQTAVYDGYVPYEDEIKRLCIERIGAVPQAYVTRKNEKNGYSYFGKLSDKNYKILGRSFDSPLFDFTLENFMKRQKGFCYAGDWSFILDLGSGVMTKCYSGEGRQQIFADIKKPIKFEAIGRCRSTYCVNSSHFISQGIIPGLSVMSYGELRNRPGAGWYNNTAIKLLGSRLYENNQQYPVLLKLKILAKETFIRCFYYFLMLVRAVMRIIK